MFDFDLSTFAGIAAATTAAVGGLKMMLPDFTKGKEAILALAIPVCLGVIAKLTGSFASMEWANLLTMLVLGGMTAQVGHDKVVNPVKELVSPKKEG